MFTNSLSLSLLFIISCCLSSFSIVHCSFLGSFYCASWSFLSDAKPYPFFVQMEILYAFSRVPPFLPRCLPPINRVPTKKKLSLHYPTIKPKTSCHPNQVNSNILRSPDGHEVHTSLHWTPSDLFRKMCKIDASQGTSDLFRQLLHSLLRWRLPAWLGARMSLKKSTWNGFLANSWGQCEI